MVSPIRGERHFSRRNSICKGREGKGRRGRRHYQYILVALKHRIVLAEAGEARALMPGCEQERSRASLGP